MNTAEPDWYLKFSSTSSFDPWYSEQQSVDATEAEVDFLLRHLAVKQGSHLLDVPCGRGNHARLLARKGYAVTGVDINKDYIEAANGWSSTDCKGKLLNFVQDDMRDLSFGNVFEGGYCLGDSLGYFGPHETELFVAGLSRALKAGARLIIDTVSIAEVLIPNFKRNESLVADNFQIEINRKYHADSSCLETEFTIDSAERVEIKRSLQWVFSTGELTRMLGKNGFNVKALYRSVDEEEFELGAKRLLLVALKT